MKIKSMKTFAEAIYASTKNKDGVDLSNALANTIEFMEKNRLLSKSKDILAHLERIIDKEDQVVRAKVLSANILPKNILIELEENLKKRYQAKKVEIDNIEDKNLIEGIKIEVRDEVIDMTISHRLHQLQEYLIKN